MNDTQIDPLIKRAVADAVMERASIELRKLLVELAGVLDPFPNFMGVSSIQAVEVEPPGASNSDNGCVVVCPDGETARTCTANDTGAVRDGRRGADRPKWRNSTCRRANMSHTHTRRFTNY